MFFDHWDATTWALVATAGFTGVVAAGVFFGAAQLFDTRKTNHAEIARQLAQTWESHALVQSRKLLRSFGEGPEAVAKLTQSVEQAFRDTKDPNYWLYTRYLNFFEQIGVSFKDHSVGFRVVDELLGGTIIDGWRTWGPVLKDVGWPEGVAKNFGELARKLALYRDEKARDAALRAELVRPFTDREYLKATTRS